MIVRILGEGQFDVADVEQAALQGFDADVEAAVSEGSEPRVHAALLALRDYILSHGKPVADDFLGTSDVVVPFPNSTIADIQALLTDEGLIPDQ